MAPEGADMAKASDTETANTVEQTDDDAPTPKHWASDWDPTLNSLLSAYVGMVHSIGDLALQHYALCENGKTSIGFRVE